MPRNSRRGIFCHGAKSVLQKVFFSVTLVYIREAGKKSYFLASGLPRARFQNSLILEQMHT